MKIDLVLNEDGNLQLTGTWITECGLWTFELER